MAHYFISYSQFDGTDFALRLYEELRKGPPTLDVWIDQKRIRPGEDWAETIDRAIKTCEAFIYVMTQDSVKARSGTTMEWRRAIQVKRPIIPVRVQDGVEEPLQLLGRQYIPFTGSFHRGLESLREHLNWLESPEGQLAFFNNRRADIERELARGVSSPERVASELAEIDEAISRLESVVADPPGSSAQIERNISTGLERERRRHATPAVPAAMMAINRPPAIAPAYFQNRVVETGILGEFLDDDSLRMIRVSGRAGVGKTAMVCRALAALETGDFPDDRDLKHEFLGIVYLGAGPARDISFANLYADISSLLPPGDAQRLEATWLSTTDTVERTAELIEALADQRVVVLLDNFEDLLDQESGGIDDQEFADALTALLDGPAHGIKLILTTRVDPTTLVSRQPGRQIPLVIGEGLQSPFAENLLRAMDRDGRTGLRDAPEETLTEVKERTLGLPRAIEAFYAILAADSRVTVDELLRDEILPGTVVEDLVSEAFHRLDSRSQRVMEALSVFSLPVIPEAIDLLLRPYVPGIDGKRALQRLTSMYLVRHDQGHYWLHPVDRGYAMAQIPIGEPSDWQQSVPPYSLHTLRHLGADYFRAIRVEQSQQGSLEDALPDVAELELLIDSGDVETAENRLDDLTDRLTSWGNLRELVRLARRIANAADTGNAARAISLAGWALTALGDYRDGARALREAIATETPDGATSEVLIWRILLADALRALGQYDEAVSELNVVLGAEVDESEYLTVKVMALQALGNVDITRDRYIDAGDRLADALRGLVAANLFAVGDTESVEVAEMVPELPVDDPSAWIALGAQEVTDDEGNTEVWHVYGITVPSGDSAGREALNLDQNSKTHDVQSEFVEVQLVRVVEQVADLWMDLARVHTLQDRYATAWNASILAEEIYESVEASPGVAAALEMQQTLAAELDEEQAQAIVRQQEQRLETARATHKRADELGLLTSLASTYHLAGDLDRAAAAYTEISQAGRDLGDTRLRVVAETGLARIEWTLDKNDDAVSRLEELLEQGIVQGTDSEFRVRLLLGDIEIDRNEHDKAERHYWAARSSLPPAPRSELELEVALSRVDLGRREYRAAVLRLERALQLAEWIQTPSTVVQVLSDLTNAYSLAGLRDAAIATGQRAVDIAQQQELPATAASALLALGQVLIDAENYEKAVDLLQDARSIYADIGDVFGQIAALGQLKVVYERSDRFDDELATARQSVELAIETGDVTRIRSERMEEALALADVGHYDDAIALINAVIEANPKDALAIGNLGWILYLAYDYENSIEASQRSRSLDPTQVWTVRNIAHAYLAWGKPDEAERYYRNAVATRRGGEDFRETIRVIRKRLDAHPETPAGQRMLDILEAAQAELEAGTPPDRNGAGSSPVTEPRRSISLASGWKRQKPR